MNYEKSYFIYAIINKVDNKKYIGFSERPKERWSDEIRAAFNPSYKCYNSPLSIAFRETGIKNFSFILLKKFNNISDALKFETIYIRYFNTFSKNGYNRTSGGEAYIRSDEDKEKQSILFKTLRPSSISEIKKGQRLSPETEFKKGQIPWNLGITHSEKTCLKMKEINKINGVKRRGQNAYNCSLTEDNILNIKNEYKNSKITYKQLGIKYGVSDTTIWRVINDILYKER